MQGKVFYIIRGNLHDGLGHPNAVVLQLATDSFLCVTGFTPDKPKYAQAKKAEFRRGVWGSAFAVEIDHARHLDPVDPGLDRHVCGYVCQTAVLMTSAQLKAGREWGTLSRQAIRTVAEGLLEREAVQPYLPKNVVVALKKMCARQP
ncbi:MAG: hypothetical protein ACFCVE_09795 [Phycisphaerae bacterium]